MNLSFICKALVAMAMVTATTANHSQALDLCKLGCKSEACCDSSSSACCPNCKYCCKLDAEVVDAEKSCFEVEEKVICIPRVVFPWQSGDCCLPFCGKKKSTCTSCDGRGCSNCSSCNNGVNNGAKIRKVRVLKSKKYKCPECEYTWTPEKTGCCVDCATGGSCCSNGCDTGCDTECYTPAPAIQTPQPQPAHDQVLPPPTAYGTPLPFSPVVQSLPRRLQ